MRPTAEDSCDRHPPAGRPRPGWAAKRNRQKIRDELLDCYKNQAKIQRIISASDKGSESMFSSNAGVRPATLKAVTGALIVAVCLSGCATKKAYLGHRATDLSMVSNGASRAQVEASIGSPEKTEQDDKVLTAWYVFDRGFIGSLEEKSGGEKIAWAPVMAWGEMVSLGLGGWITACTTPCQKGWLILQYDEHEQLIKADEMFLPDDHPLVSECARSPVRGENAVCAGVREMARPSSLPAE